MDYEKMTEKIHTQNEDLTLLKRIKHSVGRIGLALSLSLTGVGIMSGEDLVRPEAAEAAPEEYPYQGAILVNGKEPYTSNYGYDHCKPEVSAAGKCGVHNEWKNGKKYYINDQWGYDFRHCTSYVAWKIRKEFGVNLPMWGNAHLWDDRAREQGKYAVNKTPEAGDIAVWDKQHVAFVESVNKDGSVNYSDFNRESYGGPGTETGRADHYIDINGEGKPWGGGSTTPTTKPGNTTTTTTPRPTGPGEGGGNTASWGVGRLDVFTKGTNASGSNLYHKYFDGSAGWSGNGLLSDSTGIRMASQPAAVSWGPGRIDVFARSEGNLLIHKRYDGRWYPWETHAGCIKGNPSVTTWGPGRIDVFAKNCNSTGPNIMHKWFDGTWKGWETVPNAVGRIASSPAAVSPYKNRIDIFGIDQNNNNLLHNWYDNGWKPQESLGGCLTDELAVSSWEPGRFDVFAEGCNTSGQNTYHKVYDGSWHDWELLPGANNVGVAKMLGAVSWANQRIDVMARGTSGDLIHKWWNGNGWTAWESLGGQVAS